MNITYDPILEINDLRRFRVTTAIPGPKRGTALVLDPANGTPFAVMPGERVPDARFGNYRRSFVVDLANYGLRLEEDLPSRDPAFRFTTTVAFGCRVIDPVHVAVNNVRDMTTAMRSSLVKIMRGIASRYDILEFTAAENALNDALDRHHGSATVRLSNFLVELDSGPNSEIHNVLRGARLDGIRRDDMTEVVRGGRDALIAQWLAKHDGDPEDMFEREAAMEALKNEQLLELHRITMAGDKTEAFEVRRDREKVLDRFLGTGSAPTADSGRRRSRVAGSLAASKREPAGDPDKPITAEQVVPAADDRSGGSRLRGPRPSTPDTPDAPDAKPPAADTNGRKPSRVRSTGGKSKPADPDAEA